MSDSLKKSIFQFHYVDRSVRSIMWNTTMIMPRDYLAVGRLPWWIHLISRRIHRLQTSLRQPRCPPRPLRHHVSIVFFTVLFFKAIFSFVYMSVCVCQPTVSSSIMNRSSTTVAWCANRYISTCSSSSCSFVFLTKVTEWCWLFSLARCSLIFLSFLPWWFFFCNFIRNVDR